MQCRNLLLSSAIALVASASAANAGVAFHGWYVSLGAGANWIQDGDFNYKSGGVVTSANTADWDTGFATAAAVGYSFDNHWRAEFEVAYRDNDVDSICNGNGCSSSWEVWELSQMINILYDFDLGGRWSASVGAGIGGNLVTLKPKSNGASDDDYVFAGQLIAQVAYELSERWQLYADYRFMMMSEPEPSTPFFGAGSAEIEKDEHTLMIGLRFDLQPDHRMVPEPEHPMPGEPKRPKQFIVFFGFNKSNLSAEAQRVVSEAAAAAKEFGSAQIVVIGHTDTVGSPGYNMRLSLRRAGAVKSELARQGIKPGMIETSGKGETELMVETGDGVKEPQNRRATIDLE